MVADRHRLLVWGVLAILLPAGTLLAQSDDSLGQWNLPPGTTPLPTSLRVLCQGKFVTLAAKRSRSDQEQYFLVDVEKSLARPLCEYLDSADPAASIDSAEPSPDGKRLAIVSSSSGGASRIDCLQPPAQRATLIYSSQDCLDARWIGSLLLVSRVGDKRNLHPIQVIDASGAPVKSLNMRGLAAAASACGKVMLVAADPVESMRPSSLIDYDMRRMRLLAVSFGEQRLMDLGPVMEMTRRPVISPSGRHIVFRKEVGPASNAPSPTLPAPDVKLVACDVSTCTSRNIDLTGTPLGVTDGGSVAVLGEGSDASGSEIRLWDPAGGVQRLEKGVSAAALDGQQLYTVTRTGDGFALRRRLIENPPAGGKLADGAAKP